MGLIRDIVRSRRGIEPPMGRPRMVPNIPKPIPPLDPLERLPFDDPRNDFMSIQNIEDVDVLGATPVEPVIPTPIPMPIPPVIPPSIPDPKLIARLPLINPRDEEIFVPPRTIVDRELPREILPPVLPPALPPQPPVNIGMQIPDTPIGGISAVQNPFSTAMENPFQKIDDPIPQSIIDQFQGVAGKPNPFVTPPQPPVAPPVVPFVPPPITPPSIPAPTPLEKLPIQNIREQQIFVPPTNIVDRIIEDDPIVRPLPVGDSVPFVPPTLPLSRDDFMSIGGPGGGLTDSKLAEPVLTLTTPAPTTPAAVADNVGAVPPTTIPPDTRGQIDPVLAQQDTSEVLSDPLLRALYFGTADQPGFINQLQQATQNVMGAELPSTQFDPSMTQEFFNPFEDRVVQQTIQDVMEAGEKRDIQQRARDIQTGGLSAFGSRARLTAADRQEALGRGLAEALGGIRQSGFSEAQRAALGQFGDQYARQMGQINRPIDLLTTVGRSLPGYGAQQTRIDSQYRLPVDPTAAGLGAAFNTYAALTPKTGAA